MRRLVAGIAVSALFLAGCSEMASPRWAPSDRSPVQGERFEIIHSAGVNGDTITLFRDRETGTTFISSGNQGGIAVVPEAKDERAEYERLKAKFEVETKSKP